VKVAKGAIPTKRAKAEVGKSLVEDLFPDVGVNGA
jgi:hypothetical protein